MAFKRVVHADTLAALAANRFHLGALLQAQWLDSTVRVHSGRGNLTWNGHVWQGVAQLGGALNLPPDTMGTAMLEGKMMLGGDPARIQELHEQAEAARGGPVTAWLAVLTARAGNQLIGAPVKIWTGRIGAVGDDETWSAGKRHLQIDVELISGHSQRTVGAPHHTRQSQAREHPGDTAGDWVSGARARLVARVLSES